MANFNPNYGRLFYEHLEAEAASHPVDNSSSYQEYPGYQLYTNRWLSPPESEAAYNYDGALGESHWTNRPGPQYFANSLLGTYSTRGTFELEGAKCAYNLDDPLATLNNQLRSYEPDFPPNDDGYNDLSYTDDESLDLEGKAYSSQDYL
jgi:hypothetical protein